MSLKNAVSSGLALTVLGVAVSNAVAAQEVNDDATLLNEVVVTASGFEESVDEAPASISVVTREQLENKPYRDVRDAISQVPGVNLDGGPGGDISIRGLEGDSTLILIDGRRVNSTRILNQKGGNTVEYSWLPPLDAVERIEVVKGPMSSLYGSDAMGGVINIITRPSDAKWSGSIGANATLQESSESGNISQQTFYMSGPLLENKLGLKVYGAFNQRQEDEFKGGFQENDNNSINADLDYQLTDNQLLVFNLGASEDDYHARAGKSSTKDEDRINNYERYNLAVTHEGYWDWADSKLTLAYDEAKLESPTDSFTPTLENLGLNGQLVMPYEKHTLTAGAEVRKESQSIGDQTIQQGDTQVKGRVSDSVVHSAIFVEDSWQMLERLNTTAGLRYNHNSIYGDNFSPRLYGVWTATDKWVIKGGVSTGFRSPNLQEISPEFGKPQKGGSTTWGNPNLEPETSVSTELSFNYDNGDDFKGSLTLFDNRYENKISNTGSQPLDVNGDGDFGPNIDDDPEPDGDLGPDGNPISVYFNIKEARIRGVELAGNWELSPRLNALASYTYSDSNMDTDGQNIYGLSLASLDGGALINTPMHQADLGLNWQATKKVSAYIKGNYRGKELQAISLGGVPGMGDETTGDSFNVDLGASWQVNKDLVLSAAVYNLTDEVNYEVDNDDVYQYVEDGRRYWLSAKYSF
ncbi:TonB-dependent receptor [Endozoicomonas sp. 4G]|uniref:TonB-dependent receptor domain-containing protein n=1 Tax=Endozoicomonas sp. 4G TaxID=2872754 RepID=UPI0020789D67|nr:TonB-dependent receptor [Endozoicomonas sp. 4G]